MIMKLVLRCDRKSPVGCILNMTYRFDSTAGLWKVVSRMPVLVIAPVSINTLIGFKAVIQV